MSTEETKTPDQQRFEDYIAGLGYNVERFNGSYISKMTQEFWSIWQVAQSK